MGNGCYCGTQVLPSSVRFWYPILIPWILEHIELAGYKIHTILLIFGQRCWLPVKSAHRITMIRAARSDT